MEDNVITVRGLVKRYQDLIAVDGVDLDVRSGEIFSILGPNGAGKTTTVEILECIRKATEGEVTILGHDLRTGGKEIRRQIGVLPQEFNAFDLLTVRENIAFFAGMYDRQADVDELISLVDLEHKRDTYFKNLSGGLKQRVGIAIAMVNDPRIVFLDEPTTGLDPGARREVWEVIRGLRAKGRTIILTTHYMEEAEVLSDRLAIMNQGKFIALGSPSEVVAQHGGGRTCVIRGGGEAAMRSLHDMGPERDGDDVSVRIVHKEDLVSIVTALNRDGVEYEEVMLKRPTLEDVFLKLTGKSIEGGEISG
ncbi:ABC transporter ATP-binding protein [Methanomassiliicoccales archaeon RumEn M1]|nr:ABC transporter ATP-binding protein [Methanomassiliicoccales archaeon RumEn M1]